MPAPMPAFKNKEAPAMSRLKIALSELETSDADQFRASLGRLTGRLTHYWEWSDLAHADLVIVDMDSMFGHMAWLKAQGAGKQVITFARSGQVQGSDLVLPKPLDDNTFATVLEQAAGMMDHAGSAIRGAESPQPPSQSVPAPATHAPVQTAESHAPTTKPAARAEAAPAPTVTAQPAPPAPPPPAPEPEPVNVADLLVRRVPGTAMRAGDLVIDPERDAYYADDALKPLKAALDQAPSTLRPLDAATLATARQRKPHPMARLRWFAGLVATPGELAHGLSREEKYKLARWPQTEREFPRHFRIATAMMKEAATPADLAKASGVPLDEVIDYINASKAAGWLALERDEPPPAEEESAPKGKGFFRKPFAKS